MVIALASTIDLVFIFVIGGGFMFICFLALAKGEKSDK